MPSETRNVFTAIARRSPSARLYSAVPRSSQCPSMVTTHFAFFFRISALAEIVSRPASSTSELSRVKKTGFRGELRFRSSSVRFASESSDTAGCAGTGRASSTRVGPAGDVTAGPPAAEGGGCGIGAATGVCRLAHAATESAATRIAIDRPFLFLLRIESPTGSVRPIGCLVVPRARDLPQTVAVTADREYLGQTGTRRLKRNVPAARGVRGTFVASLAEGKLTGRPRSEVVDLDVIAGAISRGVSDFVVRAGRPRGTVRLRIRDVQPLRPTRAIGVHDVNLRPARTVRGEGDLCPAWRPGRRRVDVRMRGDAAQVRSVHVDDVEILRRRPFSGCGEGDPLSVGREHRQIRTVAEAPFRQILQNAGGDERQQNFRRSISAIRRVRDGARVARPGGVEVQIA